MIAVQIPFLLRHSKVSISRYFNIKLVCEDSVDQLILADNSAKELEPIT